MIASMRFLNLLCHDPIEAWCLMDNMASEMLSLASRLSSMADRRSDCVLNVVYPRSDGNGYVHT